MDNQPPPNMQVNFGPPPMPPMPQQPDPSKKAPGIMGPDMGAVLEQVNSVTRRLRMLEERYTTLASKNQLTDQNMLMHNKKQGTEIKAINQELTEVKSELAKMKETINLMIHDLRECARIEDTQVLEKYLKLWEPVKFVTANQVERIVRDVIDDMGIKAAPEAPAAPLTPEQIDAKLQGLKEIGKK